MDNERKPCIAEIENRDSLEYVPLEKPEIS